MAKKTRRKRKYQCGVNLERRLEKLYWKEKLAKSKMTLRERLELRRLMTLRRVNPDVFKKVFKA